MRAQNFALPAATIRDELNLPADPVAADILGPSDVHNPAIGHIDLDGLLLTARRNLA